jgi:hypothetical protein
MLATPLFAFIYFLFYRKAGYSFLEHLVANMYFVPFAMLFYACLVVPWQKLVAKPVWGYLLITFFVFELTYRSMAYYQLINKKGLGPWAKAFGVTLLTVAIWVAGSTALIQLYVRYGLGW